MKYDPDYSITSPSKLEPFLEQFKTKRQEHFIVFTLAANRSIIRRHIVTIGLVQKVNIHPREVFWPAIRDNAVSIIVAHNHPSPAIRIEPSQDDLDITKRLKDSSMIIGIPLVDHIIVGRNGIYSFLEDGIF
jgi:DNA repair protein RadC